MILSLFYTSRLLKSIIVFNIRGEYEYAEGSDHQNWVHNIQLWYKSMANGTNLITMFKMLFINILDCNFNKEMQVSRNTTYKLKLFTWTVEQ